jgi:hypothetical protein
VDNPALQRVLPLRAVFVSGGEKDWLLLFKPLGNRAGAELEVWRLPEVRRVGTLGVPTFAHAALTQDQRRAVLFGGNRLFPPYYVQVIDLETAAKVCDLQGYDATGSHINAVFTGAVFVAPWRDALLIDPYHVTAWDLATGKRTDLGGKPWINGDHPPQSALSPGGDRLLLCGNLHESGMAHFELWDLRSFKLLQEDTYPTTGKPWVADVQESYYALELTDYPEKGKSRILYGRWADGAQLPEPPPGAPVLALWHRDLRQRWDWMLWRDRTGLTLQHGLNKERVPLLDTAAVVPSESMVPSPDGKLLALVGRGGGIWDAGTGRRVASFPAAEKCRGFDPTGRWALTVNSGKGEITVWDTKTGQVARRCVPGQSADPPFDPADAADTALKLDPGGTGWRSSRRGCCGCGTWSTTARCWPWTSESLASTSLLRSRSSILPASSLALADLAVVEVHLGCPRPASCAPGAAPPTTGSCWP